MNREQFKHGMFWLFEVIRFPPPVCPFNSNIIKYGTSPTAIPMTQRFAC